MKKYFLSSSVIALFACMLGTAALAADWTPNPDNLKLSAPYFQQGYGQARFNRGIENRPISIAGTAYRNGLGLHADCDLLFELDGNVQTVSGAVGIDDDTQGRGSVIFRIVDESAANAKVLWDSGVCTGGQQAKAFDVKLAGVKKMRISVSQTEDGDQYDHADIVNLKMTYSGSEPKQLRTLSTIGVNDFSWVINGSAGKPLTQGIFGGRGQGNINAIAPYPIRSGSALVEPSLYVIQEDGTHNLELTVLGKTTEQIDGNVERTVFQMKDPAYPVNVDLVITTYAKENVITSLIRVKNNGTKDITLLNRDAAFVNLPRSNNAYITSFYGNWGKEMTDVREDKLPTGITKHVNTGITRVAVPDFPGCYISFDGKIQEDSGAVFAAALAWSGSWEYSVNNTESNNCIFQAGTLPSPRKLKPGEVYTSPDVIMTYSEQGKGQASRNIHDYARNYGLYNGNTVRPTVLNSWEGVYMTFDEPKLSDMIKRAADIGIEYFVLDDGWFANGKYARNRDTSGLGDWQVNKQKLPHGIQYLCDECEKNGIRFGIWVEPEMICPVSALFDAHPEYALQLKNRERVASRSQYNIDMTNPIVEDYVYNAVATLLKENPRIAYIKWDHNASANLNPGSPANPDNQGAFNDLFTEAYYRVMGKLRKNFPNVIFQACSAGGMRGEWGAMHYSEEFWGSDETNAIDRIPIQYGWTHFFPTKAIGSHIGRYKEGDYKLRADVAMTARLGVEIDPKILNETQLAVVKQGIATYKELRALLHAADLYRGRDPHVSMTTEMTFVSKDKKEAVFFGFKRDKDARQEQMLLKGLDPNAKYTLKEVNKDTENRITDGTFSGADLMKNGIRVNFPDKQSSVVVKLDIVR